MKWQKIQKLINRLYQVLTICRGEDLISVFLFNLRYANTYRANLKFDFLCLQNSSKNSSKPVDEESGRFES